MNELSDNNFSQEVLESTIPVLVVFTAPWCQPCKQLKKLLTELDSEIFLTTKVGILDVDENHKTTSEYSIRSVPTLKLFINGTVKKTHTGSLAKPQLISFLSHD